MAHVPIGQGKAKMNYDSFEEVFSYKHLMKSFDGCKKGVNWKPSVQTFEQNKGLNILKLYKELMNGTFKTKGFFTFEVKERGKVRTIKSVVVAERVLQKCLCDYCLVPVLSKSLIYDNSASLKGKGYSFAINRVEHHIRSFYGLYGSECYIAKFDVKKYFDSIPHDLVEREIRKYLKDERLINITMQIVKSFGDVGLGLGSQVSQILAVSVLNELDHYIKDDLGIRYYARYMDDSYVLHHSLDRLKEYTKLITNKCEELGFLLNQKKTKVKKLNNTEFLKIKWFLTENGRVIKKPVHESLVRQRRKLKKLKPKYDAGEMSLEDIHLSWRPWDAHMKQKDAYKERKEVRELCEHLFGKEIFYVYKDKKRLRGD